MRYKTLATEYPDTSREGEIVERELKTPVDWLFGRYMCSSKCANEFVEDIELYSQLFV